MFIQNELKSNDYISSNNINDNFISFFNKPGPYYTSYPVLGEWNDFEDTFSYENALLDFFSSSSSKPLYLYLHIPYCAPFSQTRIQYSCKALCSSELITVIPSGFK